MVDIGQNALTKIINVAATGPFAGEDAGPRQFMNLGSREIPQPRCNGFPPHKVGRRFRLRFAEDRGDMGVDGWPSRQILPNKELHQAIYDPIRKLLKYNYN